MAEIITATNGTTATIPAGATTATPTIDVAPSLAELQAELAKLRGENEKLKNAQSNASADASKYKKALQERMSEQERAANETKELIEQLKAENALMKRNQTLAEYTSGYMGLGFDAEMAKKAAEATANVGNDFSALTSVFQEYIAAHDKALNAEALRNTPRPGIGAAAPTITKEQFEAMSYPERLKVYNEQPELYKELIK